MHPEPRKPFFVHLGYYLLGQELLLLSIFDHSICFVDVVGKGRICRNNLDDFVGLTETIDTCWDKKNSIGISWVVSFTFRKTGFKIYYARFDVGWKI